MKPVGLISTAVLLVIFGAAAPARARQGQEDTKPPKQEEAKPVKQQEAKPAKQEQQAKPEKQQEAKPEKQQEQAKPVKQQETKPAKQEQQQPVKTQQAQTKSQNQQQLKQVKATRQDQQQPAKSQGHQPEQAQGQWAHNGQKDSRGHEYNESKFGRDHHTRFEATGGRMYNGRREYSYGGYWFYAGAYPAWFYQQDAYFIMGADGLWYAVAYGNPSLTFQVNIE
jgi:outer membrane biosynthesis protein TonB